MESIFVNAAALTRRPPALYMGKDTSDHIQAAVDDLLGKFDKVAVVGFATYVPPTDHPKRGNIVVANYNGAADFVSKIDSAIKGFKDVGLVVNGLSEFQAIVLARIVPEGRTAEIQQYGQAVDTIMSHLRTWQSVVGGLIVTADVITSMNIKSQQYETDLNVMPALGERLRTMLPEKVFYGVHTKPTAAGPVATVTRQDNSALALRFIVAQPK